MRSATCSTSPTIGPATAHEIVFSANDRCHQENLLQQLKNGIHALTAPVDNLESNWAYMVMTSLAWSLKAWAALRLPETGRWAEKYRADKLWLLGLEFKAFVQRFCRHPLSDRSSGAPAGVPSAELSSPHADLLPSDRSPPLLS